ncbi:MAG TPA: RNA polymerase sigma factor RpoD, partial [Clostridiales bacterium]|nr:RNA polymerase sigma factor RpoD [Clostridiales bacterium]
MAVSNEREARSEAAKQLIQRGKEHGRLTCAEIADTLQREEVTLTADQIDELYEKLAEEGIDVVSEPVVNPPRPLRSRPDGEVEEPGGLSVPDGVAV